MPLQVHEERKAELLVTGSYGLAKSVFAVAHQEGCPKLLVEALLHTQQTLRESIVAAMVRGECQMRKASEALALQVGQHGVHEFISFRQLRRSLHACMHAFMRSCVHSFIHLHRESPGAVKNGNKQRTLATASLTPPPPNKKTPHDEA